MFKKNTAKIEINGNEIVKAMDNALDDKSLERMLSHGKLDFATVGMLVDKVLGRDFITKVYKFFKKLSKSPGEFEMPRDVTLPTKVFEIGLKVDLMPDGSLSIKVIDGANVKDDK